MNQAVNFFWTILCFIPVICFWVTAGSLWYCYVFIAISLVSLIIPTRILQLSYNPNFYERTGVKFIRRFAQNGDYVNRFIRKSKPGYGVIKSKQSAAGYLITTAMYQHYHLVCLVFFLLTTGYALMHTQYWLAAAIFIANVLYNIYPILLQQYNRARVLRLSTKPC